MKNYMCVAVTKKVVSKEIFSNKESACNCFQQKFGAEILKEQEAEVEKLRKSLDRLQKKHNSEIQSENTINSIAKKQSELDKLTDLIKTPPNFHVQTSNTYREKIFIEPEICFLRIRGIYEISGHYEVIEEQYLCLSELLRTNSDFENIHDSLPEQFHAKNEALYITPDSNGKEKAIVFIAKMKKQILREHLKDTKKL